MKILFVCGCLELGRDGVGDYIYRLSLELTHQSHQVKAIALNDHYIDQEFSGNQSITNDGFITVRLPSIWPATKRFNRAKDWIEIFNPEWISLQFVPYAFNSKGLPMLLGWYLRNLVGGKQVHMMVHEIWIGANSESSIKQKLLSFLQKTIINNIITNLRPDVIHTHLPFYYSALQRLGWNPLPLPLFSNIPESSLSPLSLDSQNFRIGIFSQIDNNDTFVTFLTALVMNATQLKLRCQVILIGGNKIKMTAFKTRLETIPCLQGQVHDTGFLNPTQLSATLKTCNLGLTPVPRHGLGKSGTVAAFLAHGIPVAAPNVHSQDKIVYPGFFHQEMNLSIVTTPDIRQLTNIYSFVLLAKELIHISRVSSIFLADLSMNNKKSYLN